MTKLTIKLFMISTKNLKIIFILFISSIFLNSCGGKLPGADARKYDPDPKKRVAKNLEQFDTNSMFIINNKKT